jgi:hypothetical protein
MQTEQLLTQSLIATQHQPGGAGSGKRHPDHFEKRSYVLIETSVSGKFLGKVEDYLGLVFGEGGGDAGDIIRDGQD